MIWPIRSAAISRIRSGSCSAWRVRAASTRNRAKLRSSSAAAPASGSGVISIGALSVSPRSRKTRTSRRWNQATGTTSSVGSATPASIDQRMSEVRSDAVLDAHVGHRRRGRLGVDAARNDPAAEAGDENDGSREVGLGNLVLRRAERRRRVEEDEVGTEICDQPSIERGGEDPVDRQQEAEVTKLERDGEAPTSSRSASISLWMIQASSPGFTAWRRACAARSKSSDGQQIAVQRERGAPPGRCAERASAPPQISVRGATSAGRGSASYPRSTRSMRSITGWSATPVRAALRGTVGGNITHDCGFQAVPHIGSLIGTIPP